MKTTMHIFVGGEDEVKLALHDGDRPVGTLKVTGQGVTWLVGNYTHDFPWDVWLQMIADRRSAVPSERQEESHRPFQHKLA